MLLKPLVGLVFNSQKCRDTFVNSYYLTSVRVSFKLSPREGSRRKLSLGAKTVKASLLLFWLLKFCSLSRTHVTYTFRQSIAIGAVILMLMVLRIYKGFAIPTKSALTIPLSLSSVKTDLTLGMHHIVHGRS